MVGVARSYIKGVSNGSGYRALVTAVKLNDKGTIAQCVDDLDRKINKFGLTRAEEIDQTNLNTDRRTRFIEELKDKNRMGEVSSSHLRLVEAFLGNPNPRSHANEIGFLEGLRRQAEQLIPEWYSRTSSDLRYIGSQK